MLTDEEFEEAFSQVEAYVDQLGDEIVDRESGEFEKEEEDEEAIEYRSLAVNEKYYDCIYTVNGTNETPVFLLRYPFDFLSVLMGFVESEDAKDVFNIDDFAQQDPRDAAIQILNRVSEDDLERLKFNLHEKISNPDTFSTIRQLEEGGIEGFDVDRHIFPLDESFGLPDFYEATMAVSSTGEHGRRYLTNSFAIQVPEDIEEESEFSLTFDPNELF